MTVGRPILFITAESYTLRLVELEHQLKGIKQRLDHCRTSDARTRIMSERHRLERQHRHASIVCNLHQGLDRGRLLAGTGISMRTNHERIAHTTHPFIPQDFNWRCLQELALHTSQVESTLILTFAAEHGAIAYRLKAERSRHQSRKLVNQRAFIAMTTSTDEAGSGLSHLRAFLERQKQLEAQETQQALTVSLQDVKRWIQAPPDEAALLELLAQNSLSLAPTRTRDAVQNGADT